MANYEYAHTCDWSQHCHGCSWRRGNVSHPGKSKAAQQTSESVLTSPHPTVCRLPLTPPAHACAQQCPFQ